MDPSNNATSSPTMRKSAQTKKKLDELPVIMMLLEVTPNAGQKIGTCVDLASDTNYITNQAAKRFGLASEKSHSSSPWGERNGNVCKQVKITS